MDMAENKDYLCKQIITYLGNKRALLPFIYKGVEIVFRHLGKKKLRIFDVFSGSGVVARFFKRYSTRLIVNDLEKYSQVINLCYLANKSRIDIKELMDIYAWLMPKLEKNVLRTGLISELYAPQDEIVIREKERAFYTNRNAQYIDTVRQYIGEIPPRYKNFLLAPLLSEASIHSNTSGVFKGFYKSSETGIGKFGGKNENALSRIMGDIRLPFPVFSNFECDWEIHRGDSNVVADIVDEVDLAYIDPPYNQHPYGSNYFMLNLIVNYTRPGFISKVSGIPNDWNRSEYNKKARSFTVFKDLIERIKAKYLLISYNSEGHILPSDMAELLGKTGKVTTLETRYNTFRGGRNLKNRNTHTKEYLYLVKKK